MKKVWFILLPLVMVCFGISSCDDEDPMIDLPTIVDNYLNTNYPDYEVDESELETDCKGAEVYEVELEGPGDDEIELTFDSEGNFLYAETEIGIDELPAAVSSSISSNYPDYSIEEAEQLDMFDDTVRYEVELKSGSSTLEVIFAADGTVICEQEDDEE